MLTDIQIAFKAAARRAVKMAGGPVAAAKDLRVDAGRLSYYGNPTQPLFIPLDVAYEVDKLAGDPVILRAFADLCGYEIVPREANKDGAEDLTVAAAHIARESGELISTTIEAAADGVVTPNEAQRIHSEASDLENKIVKLKETARQRMGGCKSK